MCSVFGALGKPSAEQLPAFEAALKHIAAASTRRGRDGWGYVIVGPSGRRGVRRCGRGPLPELDLKLVSDQPVTIIGNTRAEPTTEYVRDKKVHDQQPYTLDRWSVVHNGTIANDKDLRTYDLPTAIDSAAIVETLVAADNLDDHDYHQLSAAASRLEGSYAILACSKDPRSINYAVNYRPLWYAIDECGTFFASCRTFFPPTMIPEMLDPYSSGAFTLTFRDSVLHTRCSKIERTENPRALVIASGGLDSTVAAAIAQSEGYEIELAHFQYGSRAEGPEVQAVREVAEALGAPLRYIPMNIYDPSDSPLLQADSAIAGGEAGAEFAHEWVPARNLVMLSLATAYAEAHGFQYLVLGNNLEEAGAYPDNEPEFIQRFNDLLPFAVGDGKRVRVIMPVGNMMKHEIVAAGNLIKAPLDRTWSCYRAGAKHCGTCGPCYMRRKAFEINNLEEVIDYVE